MTLWPPLYIVTEKSEPSPSPTFLRPALQGESEESLASYDTCDVYPCYREGDGGNLSDLG